VVDPAPVQPAPVADGIVSTRDISTEDGPATEVEYADGSIEVILKEDI
jgi:hypothetical protein